MNSFKNFNEKELYLIQESLQEYDRSLAKIIKTRNSWNWEEFKKSSLCGFRNEEEFKKWINDMNTKMQKVEKISDKLDYIIYGE